MPGVSFDVDYDDDADARRAQLLALRHLWRDLEQLAAGIAAIARAPVAVANNDLARTLEELIAALDRRIPHLEREGEAEIVDEAAILRKKAIERLAELTSGR